LVLGVACTLLACRKPTGSASGGSFEDARQYLVERVHPVAGRWQAAERRAAALQDAKQPRARAEALREADGLALRWAGLLEDAPTPLPLRAPFARQRKVLLALASSKGAARAKQLDELLRVLEDLGARNVVPAPHPGKPLADGDPLVRLWRDVGELDAQQGGRPGGEAGPAQQLGALAGVLQGASPQQPGDGPALQLASEMLLLGQAYLANPPSVDMETARALRSGSVRREEVIEAAICRALAPLKPRLAALAARKGALSEACAGGARCSPEAADVVHHPVMRQLDELRERAGGCAAKAAQAADAPPGDAATVGDR